MKGPSAHMSLREIIRPTNPIVSTVDGNEYDTSKLDRTLVHTKTANDKWYKVPCPFLGQLEDV
jgi:uncharacterized protein (UPF0216 family)